MISQKRKTRWIVYGVVAALAILHQDFWFWRDRTLVFGFMPIGLAYHALFSILSAVAWALVMKFAWPTHIEAFAEGADPDVKAAGAGSGGGKGKGKGKKDRKGAAK